MRARAESNWCQFLSACLVGVASGVADGLLDPLAAVIRNAAKLSKFDRKLVIFSPVTHELNVASGWGLGLLTGSTPMIGSVAAPSPQKY